MSKTMDLKKAEQENASSPAGPEACLQVLWVPGAWLVHVPSWCWQEAEVWASGEQGMLLLLSH